MSVRPSREKQVPVDGDRQAGLHGLKSGLRLIRGYIRAAEKARLDDVRDEDLGALGGLLAPFLNWVIIRPVLSECPVTVDDLKTCSRRPPGTITPALRSCISGIATDWWRSLDARAFDRMPCCRIEGVLQIGVM
jgi:hypothetical protein